MSVWKLIPALGCALLLAACGGSPDNTSGGGGGGGGCNASSTASGSPAQVVKLVSDPNTVGAFDPKTVTVKVGQAVEWDWQDPSSSHTVTADNGSFDSGLCSQGTKFVQTFSSPGTVTYKCSIHSGMQGTVTVTS